MSKQHKLDSRWFKEDYVPGNKEQTSENKLASEKAIRAATVSHRRLTGILKEEVRKTYSTEEDFSDPAWERKVLASASRRKTLLEIINLLP